MRRHWLIQRSFFTSKITHMLTGRDLVPGLSLNPIFLLLVGNYIWRYEVSIRNICLYLFPLFSCRSILKGHFLIESLPSYAFFIPILLVSFRNSQVDLVLFIFPFFCNLFSLFPPLTPYILCLYELTRCSEFWSVKLSRKCCLSGHFRRRYWLITCLKKKVLFCKFRTRWL